MIDCGVDLRCNHFKTKIHKVTVIDWFWWLVEMNLKIVCIKLDYITKKKKKITGSLPRRSDATRISLKVTYRDETREALNIKLYTHTQRKEKRSAGPPIEHSTAFSRTSSSSSASPGPSGWPRRRPPWVACTPTPTSQCTGRSAVPPTPWLRKRGRVSGRPLWVCWGRRCWSWDPTGCPPARRRRPVWWARRPTWCRPIWRSWASLSRSRAWRRRCRGSRGDAGDSVHPRKKKIRHEAAHGLIMS